MFKKDISKQITIECKICKHVFHSVEAFRSHQRKVWSRLSHKSLFDYWKYNDLCVWCGNEVHIHKSLRHEGYESSCIICGWLYDEYVPDREEAASYILEGTGR